MAQNFNNAPYFDDYLEQQADGTLTAKPFYKVLFKPGFAIQARELNQLQSILGHQVASIGNHLFKKNANIVPGGISYNDTADIVFLAEDTIETAADLVGKTITNAPSFDPTDFTDVEGHIIAVVLAAKEATDDEPACLYVKYTNTQTDGRGTFSTNETLKTIDPVETVEFTTHDTIGSTVGKTASIANGVFYTKELFVDVPEQHIIVEADSTTVVSSAIIGLNVIESIVTAQDDETLYDNANGSPNEYAPGADRYRIDLVLARYDVNTTGLTDDNFIRLIVIDNDTITYLNNNTEYAYLMEVLARRTFDANGNFVVRGLETTVSDSRDDDYITGNVSRGKAYLGGYEYDQIADRSIPIVKPRGDDYQFTAPRKNETPSAFTYFYIAGDTGINSSPGDYIQFLPFADDTLLPIDVSVSPVVGYGIYRGLEYVVGSIGDKDIYRVLVDDITMDVGWTISDVGAIRATSVPGTDILATEVSTVLHEIKTGGVVGIFNEGDVIINNSPENQYTGISVSGVDLDPDNLITLTNPNLPLSLIDIIRPGWVVTQEGGGSEIGLGYGWAWIMRVEKSLVVAAGNFVTGRTYTILTVGSTDFTTIGASSNDIGVTFVATGVGSGDGTATTKTQNGETPNAVVLTMSFSNNGAVSGTVKLSDPSTGTIYKIRGDVFYVKKHSPQPVPDVSFKLDPANNTTTAGNFMVGREYTIKTVGTTDFTLIGASSSAVGVVFIATGSGSGTGTATPTNATASVASYFVSNHAPDKVPLIKVDEEPIAYFIEDNFKYYIIRSDTFSIPASGADVDLVFSTDGSPGGVLPAPDEFVSRGRRYFWGYLPDEDIYVDLTDNGASVDMDAQDYTITLEDGVWSYWEQPLVVYAAVEKNDAVSSTKEKTVATVSIPTPSLSWMPLDHQDVVEVEKIVEGRVINVTAASWTTGTATLTCTYTRTASQPQYNHVSGQTVVIRGIVSANNTTGDYLTDEADPFSDFAGFNGQHEITAGAAESAPDGDGLITVTVTLTYPVTANPGLYTSGGTVALEADVNNDTDVTNRFIWDSGNTASVLGTGMVKRISGSIVNTGQLGVKYYYYEIPYVADFVNINSYNDNTGPDYDHVGDVADITDPLGNVIHLRSCLDYRTRLSKLVVKNIASIESGSNVLKLKNLNLSLWGDEIVGTIVIGPTHGQGSEVSRPARIGAAAFNPTTGDTELLLTSPISPYPDADASFTVDAGNYLIGAKAVGDDTAGYLFSLVDATKGGLTFNQPYRRLNYSYRKFLQRQLMLFIKRDENNLLSLDTVDVPDIYALNNYVRDPNKLPLAYIHMKPYTFSTRDVTVVKFEMPVYQMIDIHQIKNRVDRIEDVVSRSLDTVDAGDDVAEEALGFWSEDFTNYSTPDYLSSEFECTVYDQMYAAPGTVTKTIALQLSDVNSSQRRQSGSVVTLPYEEVRAFGNSSCSSYSNLNPFNMIQWEGKMRLYPSVDNWIEVTGNPPPATDGGVSVPFPTPPTHPPYTIPKEPKKEIVTEINILNSSWGPDSSRGKHAITFEWATSKGRRGRVNTDIHLSPAIRKRGAKGYDGTFAKSLLNRKYTDTAVKEYLQAGQHFDQKPPEEWRD